MGEVRRTEPVEAKWLGGYHASVSVRQFTVDVDEPPSVGGWDEGPMPTEYLLIALSSCYALAIAHVARRDGIELGPFRVTAQGVYDGPCFASFELMVRTDGPPPPELGGLLQRARRVCYVSNTLARSVDVVARIAD